MQSACLLRCLTWFVDLQASPGTEFVFTFTHSVLLLKTATHTYELRPRASKVNFHAWQTPLWEGRKSEIVRNGTDVHTLQAKMATQEGAQAPAKNIFEHFWRVRWRTLTPKTRHPSAKRLEEARTSIEKENTQCLCKRKAHKAGNGSDGCDGEEGYFIAERLPKPEFGHVLNASIPSHASFPLASGHRCTKHHGELLSCLRTKSGNRCSFTSPLNAVSAEVKCAELSCERLQNLQGGESCLMAA